MKSAQLHPLAVLILLAVVSAAIYSNTLHSPFEFDDIPNIVENPLIGDPGNYALLPGPRPVGFLTFALNYRVGGLDVFGYHLVNLLIHIVNGFLVFALARLLIRAASGAGPPADERPALAVALLFVVHPVQTEAVTYVVQRFASLAALFYLLAVVSFLKARLAPSGLRTGPVWFAASVLSAFLAMKTKEIAFTLPVMILLIDLLFIRIQWSRRWIVWILYLPLLAVIPASNPQTIHIGGGLPSQTPLIGRLDYLFTQFPVVVTYLRLLVLPVGQNLDYDFPVFHSFFGLPVMGSFLILAALGSAALFLLLLSRERAGIPPRPEYRLIGFGLLWFFLALSVESTIIPIEDVIFEHRLYLPSAGFFLAAVFAVRIGLNRLSLPFGKGTRRAVFAAIVVILCVATYGRNAVWKNGFTLWKNAVEGSPDKARPHLNLGVAYHEWMKQPGEALEEYQAAIRLDPGLQGAHFNLGLIYDEMGRAGDAVREYRTAVGLRPDHAESHAGLGLAYLKLGLVDEAAAELKNAVGLDPVNPDLRNNLANILSDSGRLEEAVSEYREAVRLRPGSPKILHNLGLALYGLGRLDEARAEIQNSLALDPGDADAHYNLGVIFERARDWTAALREFEAAVRLNPDDRAARKRLGGIYLHLEKLPEARGEFERAVRLDPDDAEAHYNLGRVFEKMGISGEARSHFRETLRLDPGYK